MKNYFLSDDYTHRLENAFFDDTPFKDEWQKEVYTFARRLADNHQIQSVADIGTGSGFKLLDNFKERHTLGIDLPTTVEWLKRQYPDRAWSDKFEPVAGYDLIISSDVIEHLPDPDVLLDLIIQSNPKFVVLSTPDRDLRGIEERLGPPNNVTHVREWNMPEFKSYINSKLNVLTQFISNKEQCTQVILATLK